MTERQGGLTELFRESGRECRLSGSDEAADADENLKKKKVVRKRGKARRLLSLSHVIEIAVVAEFLGFVCVHFVWSNGFVSAKKRERQEKRPVLKKRRNARSEE